MKTRIEEAARTSFKIFKPRDKDVSCEHWIDCYKNAEWCTEHQSEEGSYFQFFCKNHLDRLVASEKEALKQIRGEK